MFLNECDLDLSLHFESSKAVFSVCTFFNVVRSCFNPSILRSTLWQILQKIHVGCSPRLFASHTTFSARKSYHVLRPLFPLSSLGGLAPQASSSIYTLPLKDDKQCIPRVL